MYQPEKAQPKRRKIFSFSRPRPRTYFLNGPNAVASIAPTLIRRWTHSHPSNMLSRGWGSGPRLIYTVLCAHTIAAKVRPFCLPLQWSENQFKQTIARLFFIFYSHAQIQQKALSVHLSTDRLSLVLSLTHSLTSSAPAVYKGLGGKPSARIYTVGNQIRTGMCYQTPSHLAPGQPNSTNRSNPKLASAWQREVASLVASDHCHPEYTSQHSPPRTSTTGRSTDSDVLLWISK